MYNGPKIKMTKKPFSKNFLPKGGYVLATIVRVKDGDTFIAKVNGVRETIRLLVIDTPELAKDEPFAVEAKQYLEETLKNGHEIYLQSDKKSDLRDNTESKRLLAWLWVDGELVNYNLVKFGFARVRYIQNEKLRYLKALKKAELKAIQKKRKIHQGE